MYTRLSFPLPFFPFPKPPLTLYNPVCKSCCRLQRLEDISCRANIRQDTASLRKVLNTVYCSTDVVQYVLQHAFMNTVK
jgi:hypothetical protein